MYTTYLYILSPLYCPLNAGLTKPYHLGFYIDSYTLQIRLISKRFRETRARRGNHSTSTEKYALLSICVPSAVKQRRNASCGNLALLSCLAPLQRLIGFWG